jgi:hypothetical protein
MKINFQSIKRTIGKTTFWILLIGIIASVIIIVCDLRCTCLTSYIWWKYLPNFALAYLSSFIFYLIVNVLKTQNDRKHINPHISHQIEDIIRLIQVVCEQITTVQKKDKSRRTWSDSIKDTLKVDLKNLPPPTLGNKPDIPKISDFNVENTTIRFEVQRVKETISDTLKLVPYLDAELITLLDKIQSSSLLKTQIQYFEKNILVEQSAIDECLALANKLKKYTNT